MPRRLGVPLFREVDPLCADYRRFEGEARRALQLLGELAADRVGDVDLAAFECREPRRLVGYDLEDDAFDAGGLAPILVERLHDELDARRERDEFVGPGADRRFLEPLVADLLDVFLWHHPAG